MELSPVNGRTADPSRPPADPVLHLRDIFDYRLERDRVYQMLLTPTVEALQDPALGPGQYSVLYLHDPESDLPAGRFPERGIDAAGLLDCLRDTFGTATRFDALVAAVDAGSDQIWNCRP